MRREGAHLAFVLSSTIAPRVGDFLGTEMGIMTGADFSVPTGLVRSPSPRGLTVCLAWRWKPHVARSVPIRGPYLGGLMNRKCCNCGGNRIFLLCRHLLLQSCTTIVSAWTCSARAVRTSCWVAIDGGGGEARGSTMWLGTSLQCEECLMQLKEASWAWVFVLAIRSTSGS